MASIFGIKSTTYRIWRREGFYRGIHLALFCSLPRRGYERPSVSRGPFIAGDRPTVRRRRLRTGRPHLWRTVGRRPIPSPPQGLPPPSLAARLSALVQHSAAGPVHRQRRGPVRRRAAPRRLHRFPHREHLGAGFCGRRRAGALGMGGSRRRRYGGLNPARSSFWIATETAPAAVVGVLLEGVPLVLPRPAVAVVGRLLPGRFFRLRALTR